MGNELRSAEMVCKEGWAEGYLAPLEVVLAVGRAHCVLADKGTQQTQSCKPPHCSNVH